MTDVSTLLFVAQTGQLSGAEKVLLDLVGEALAQGYAAIVACPAGPLVDALPAASTHVPIPALGMGGERSFARLLGAAQLAARWRAAARILAPLARTPGTETIVNSLFALPAVRMARPPRGAGWLVHDTITSTKQRAATRLGAPAVRVAVAVSEATARPLRAFGFPVRVAHNGVRWPVPRLTGADLHDPPVVGMLALLTPWKGHRVLLDAVARLPGVQVELAGGSFPGDVGYVAELHARAARPDLAGRVRFLGHVDACAALRRWDVAVSASISPEAGPLSVLEAMSHGLPVIGTDHGGTTEFLSGGAGFLVPPGDEVALADAIATVLRDDDVRSALSTTARRRVAEHHDLRTTLPAMLRTLLG
ncbi:glycosyl transferase [Mycolicibacterium madagascariense]|uniref:Glycosyl transferase n=1 Tax=Mycolicibacterium madagascariense TaxID=212765 RepID=A0A7I7XET6_9MYCO|nr:glycosyltransferase family 4 protein [Mycolicibacterium madagascariense]MCV7015399.1 glycosyltransferase family 4 protein [Mycolicibacterium madagascariense]BBZ27697.1 glycosyl transferase [Mycolicibacterium madagascariense]